MKRRWNEATGSGAGGQEAGLTHECSGFFVLRAAYCVDRMIALEQTVWGPLWNATAMIGHGVELG
jgi:hypothetical protein